MNASSDRKGVDGDALLGDGKIEAEESEIDGGTKRGTEEEAANQSESGRRNPRGEGGRGRPGGGGEGGT